MPRIAYEAKLVRRIFERYLALGSVNALRAELDQDGIRTPVRHHRRGGSSGGADFPRGKLYAMLANPIFIGRIRHGNKVHSGQHAAILDESLWQAVQDRLAVKRRTRFVRSTAQASSPLAGRLFDPDGVRMRPSHASKKGKRYRYYVSASLIERGVEDGASGWRIPAGELEAAVARAVAIHLRAPGFQSEMLTQLNACGSISGQIIERIGQLAEQLDASGPRATSDLLHAMVARVDLRATELRAEVQFPRPPRSDDDDASAAALAEATSFSVASPIRMQRRGCELRLVLQGAAASAPDPDPRLIRVVIEGRIRAADYLDPGRGLTVSDIARREGTDVGDVSRALQLAFLAPDLLARILDGTQPLALTAERLKRVGELPLLWDDQRAAFA